MSFGPLVARPASLAAAGEEKIEASRQRGATPKEGSVPIGVTGFTMGDD